MSTILFLSCLFGSFCRIVYHLKLIFMNWVLFKKSGENRWNIHCVSIMDTSGFNIFGHSAVNIVPISIKHLICDCLNSLVKCDTSFYRRFSVLPIFTFRWPWKACRYFPQSHRVTYFSMISTDTWTVKRDKIVYIASVRVQTRMLQSNIL